MNNVHYSRRSDEWYTPGEIYSWFVRHDYFDPCPKCHVIDGLSIDWKEKNFINPPYSQLRKWVAKAVFECRRKHKYCVLLIPARTDTQAFKMLFEAGARFVFIIGRLRFSDALSAPFPSCFVILSPTSSRCFLDYVDRECLASSMERLFCL